MPILGSPPRESDSARQTLQIVGTGFYAGAAGVAVLGAALLGFLPHAPSLHAALIGALLVFAALCGLAWRRGERLARDGLLAAAALAALGLLGWLALALPEGARHPAFGLGAVIVCLTSAVIRLHAALALAALALAGVAAFAGLEPPRSAPAAPLSGTLALQWLVLLAALAAGRLIARALHQQSRLSNLREDRYRGLLDVAADGLWEMDEQFRFTAVPNWHGMATPPAEERVGRTPWQVGDTGLTEWQLDAHRADLEAHRRFTGLLVRRRDAQGAMRIHSVSGAPKFDEAGIFRGYWGVTRDVTDEVLAQRAMITVETRYRELFERSPSPLLLHRRGIIFDANPAAARLFGFGESAAMHGFLVAELYPPGEHRERAQRRLGELEAMQLGEALPVADFKARARDGHAIHVQATAVRVDTASGPATLSILFDITARQAVEAALRRSEAMLSHLFATSPDCITLSELASGRHTMVNAAFSRVTGFAAEEVIGRSAAELGLWYDPQAGQQLTEQIMRDGSVAELPLPLRSRNGTRVAMMISAARFVMDGRDYMVVNGRDVTQTERTRLEHAAILERASIGIAFTRDGRFVVANPRFEQMFGWALGTLSGEPAASVWVDDAAAPTPGPAHDEPFEGELQMRRRDGSVFWCRLLAQRVDRSHPSHGGTIWIADDVTERRRLDQALAAARDAAEAANRAKSAFLANTSHEIRTPLNGLLGLVRLALLPDLEAGKRQEYLRQLSDSAQGLAGILSDILDLSKIEAGKVMLEHVAFDLGEALLALQRSYRTLAHDRGLELALEIDPALPETVTGDPVRVRQILSNFVSNAIKFTSAGAIRIQAICEGADDVRLQVVDSGVGIDAATQRRLFEPFSQADTSTTRRHGGTGLGLSICRELAHLMGGEVGVRSRAGRGSTFWARLPLRSTGLAAETPSSEAEDLEQLHGTRVLLVEDNPVNMLIAAATLEQWGVEVVQAQDGPSAIALVDAGTPFDAVLMDVQMPEMSGHETTLELRKRHPPLALPIIALTAAALVSERERALAAGMNDFLTKPLDAPLLRRTLARHIAARREC
jgi:PAS domain S-box-containing protein